MSLLSILLFIVVTAWLVIPYLICIILKFALWKYQFTSKPTSLFALTNYKDIVFRIPIGLNQNVLLFIEQISFNIWPVVKIKVHGLSLNILVKNEFNQWKNHQIELLKMLDDIRTRLKRNGALSQVLGGVSQAIRNLSQTSMSDDNMLSA
jgi:hypothetical protein